MSKDKGSKNHKKAPASKADAKLKPQSAYKTEGKNGALAAPLVVFNAKTVSKAAEATKP